ncbi:hypothetical protein H9Y04_32230 [Streptomyces sp. TRM66268-LWL]|uniref:Secreted protein n=1 Tax=Streptomyces polyasparticus TaxID=2767826 RepID=A0ABR7SRQ9_9ACTN|nr:hypothetical protein [Streptomyces polyasparticus]MBC9717206.1 hypothetical protein [Streptomyces polyasparticus]
MATLLGALVAGFALVLMGASGASAGGPTSVLLSSPTSGKAAGLSHQDKEYEELTQLLGVGRGFDSVKAPPMDDTMEGEMVNATWLIHDVTPWRVDQIHVLPNPDAASKVDVFIHTVEAHGDESLNQLAGAWHRPQQAGELLALLKSLDLLGAPDPAAGGEGTTAGSGADETAGTGAETGSGSDSDAAAGGARDGSTTIAADTPVSTGWWWAIPGIAAGAALALGIRPVARQLPTWPAKLREARAAARDEGPRGELIDR